MDCLASLLVAVLSFSSLSLSQTMAANSTVLDLIAWQETVEEVNRTASLAQVLKEFLDDIETVEAAASLCADGHRESYCRGQRSLRTALELCVARSASDRQRQTLVLCVEEHTRAVVSDVRQHIVALKTCLDRT